MSASAIGLYTQEQQDYVNGIKDEDLRSHLLHQVRLRDNMEGDRNAFEKIAGQWPTVEKAVSRIVSELQKDKSEGSYYYSWQSNIAMAFFDEYQRFNPNMKDGNIEILHRIANNAAKNFLDNLILPTSSQNNNQ